MHPTTLGQLWQRLKNLEHLPDSSIVTVEDRGDEKWLVATTTYGDSASIYLTGWGVKVLLKIYSGGGA